jgi:hypothetical protein
MPGIRRSGACGSLRWPRTCLVLERIFETKTAEQWEEWATERDLPLAAVRHLGHGEEHREDETTFASERRRTPTRGEDKP